MREWHTDEGAAWKLEELSSMVTDAELEAIQKIRCYVNGSEDFLMWNHTKNGEFSVRSAYHLEVEKREGNIKGSNGDLNKRLLKKIWSASVSPKVPNLVWRTVHNALPTMKKLTSRGMEAEQIYPRCGDKEDDVEHLIPHCNESKKFWRVSPARVNIEGEIGEKSLSGFMER